MDVKSPQRTARLPEQESGQGEKFNDDFLIQNIVKNSNYTDFVIRLKYDGTSTDFKLHRIVMSFCSRLIRELDDGVSVLKIVGIKPGILRKLIEFCYHGSIDVEADEIPDIMNASFKLGIDESLIDWCSQLLADSIQLSNYFEFKSLSKQLDNQILKDAVFDFILKNFMIIRNTNEFLTTNYDDFLQIIESTQLKANSEEDVYESVIKWLNNLHRDIALSSNQLLRLLKCVRLQSLSASFFFGKVKNEKIFKKDPLCYEYIRNIREFLRDKATSNITTTEVSLLEERKTWKNALQSNITKPVESQIEIMETEFQHIEVIDTENKSQVDEVESTPSLVSDQNETSPSLDENITEVSELNGEENEKKTETTKLAVIDQMANNCYEMLNFQERKLVTDNSGIIVCTGGRTSDNVDSDIIQIIDTKIQSVFPIDTLPVPRMLFGLASLNGSVYIAGGKVIDSTTVISSLHSFCPATSEWRMDYPDMPSPRWSFHLVSDEANNALYAIGGKDVDGMPCDTNYKYSFENDQWSSIQASTKRVGAAVALLNNKLYVAGGQVDGSVLNSVEVYCLETNKWTNVRGMNHSRKNATAAVHNNLLYVVGGSNVTGISLDLVEKYDPVTDQWTLISSLPQCRSLHAMVCTNDTLFVLGGVTDDNKKTKFIDAYYINMACWFPFGALHESSVGLAAVHL